MINKAEICDLKILAYMTFCYTDEKMLDKSSQELWIVPCNKTSVPSNHSIAPVPSNK